MEVESLKKEKSSAKEEPEVHSFEHAGEQYEILVPNAVVVKDGEVHRLTAADIAATPEIQAHLVEKGSGVIRKKA
jgi:hypothetical protein